MTSRAASLPPRPVRVFSSWDRRSVPAPEVPRGAESSFYHRILEGSREGVAVVDSAGLIVFCNGAAAALFGSTPEDLAGREFGFPYARSGEPAAIEIFTGGQPTFVEMVATPIS